MDNVARNLVGLKLKTGWLVKSKIEKLDNQTGSFFSVCYTVEKENMTCFMKVFDFSKFFNPDRHTGVVDALNEMTTAYKYERDLSGYCKDKHVTKVAFVIDAGEEFIEGYTFGTVPYLIFDLAEGDIRKKISLSKNLDDAWLVKSLHDVAVGLNQLHKISVSHQDLKPSNILVFSNESKIGDIGRSICFNFDGPYKKCIFSGDYTYAPPEIMYNYHDPDMNKRNYATDCYLLGSLIVFYFSGIPMNALLRKNIPDNFSWEQWTGSYHELEPYLEDAFSKALNEFGLSIRNSALREDLVELVKYLCNPIPIKRGHPKSIASIGSNYGLERFVSMLARLQKKAEIMVTNG